LWRNRVGVEQLEIHVKISNAAKKWVFDGTQISTQHFDDISDDIVDLANHIADALSGKVKFLLLEVSAYAQIGHAQDVYPSEELVLDKGNSKSKKVKFFIMLKMSLRCIRRKLVMHCAQLIRGIPNFQSMANPSPLSLMAP
jgi:CRISPR-associated protein Csy3